MNPSPAPSAGVDQDDPSLALEAVAAQQQRDLALLLLEQGQNEQWQRVTFNQALLAAAQQHSTLPAIPMNRSIAEPGSDAVDASIHSAVSSSELQREYMLDHERQHQRVLPQQHSQSISTADFQRELLLDVERQRQRVQFLRQQSSQQQSMQLQLDSNALLQQNLGRLLAAGLSQENYNAGTSSVPTRATGVDSTELDRLLATESLLRRSRLQDAVNMLQNQGILLEDTLNRGNSTFSSANASSTPCFPRQNGPFLSQLLQSAAGNCASISNRPMTTGVQDIGHMGLLPGSILSIGGPRDSTVSSKRNSDEKVFSEKEAKKQKAEPKAGSASCFPLPSRKHSRRISMKLSSFHALWNKLGDCALRQELFRRRLSRNFKASSKTAQL
jgi:hypothetical protein